MSPGAVAKKSREFDPEALLAGIGEGRKAVLFPKRQTIFAQGDPADAVFYLQTGKVKLAFALPDACSCCSSPKSWVDSIQKPYFTIPTLGQ